jgi:hypothetical protein
MLEHLIDFEPEVLSRAAGFAQTEKVSITQTVDAKVSTSDWLKSLGAVDTETAVSQAQTAAAQRTFANIVSAAPVEITHQALAEVKTPQAVQHLVSMLTAYDWEFVNRAKELRGYCVAQLLEETKHDNPNVRLKALGLLGKVTEVGLFTEKIEVKKAELSDIEIEQRIKDKLNKFMQVVDVVDVSEVPDDSTA